MLEIEHEAGCNAEQILAELVTQRLSLSLENSMAMASLQKKGVFLHSYPFYTKC